MRILPLLLPILLFAVSACNSDLSDEELVAAKADQTLRNLIAGMNAKNLPVLQKLLVVTSTTGGKPRALRGVELKQVVFNHPPYTYAGPGKPGTMLIKDGQGGRHAVRMIVLDDALKVVAARRSLGGGAGVQVISLMEPAPPK